MRLKKHYAALLRSAGFIALAGMCAAFSGIIGPHLDKIPSLKSILALPRISFAVVFFALLTVAWEYYTLRTASARAILASRNSLPTTAREYVPYCLHYLAANALEELLFRGTLIAVIWNFGLKAALAAIPIQSALWAVGHFTNPHHKEKDRGITTADIVDRACTFLNGCLLGIIALFTGGILIPYLLHLFTNFLWNYELWKVQRGRKSPVAYAPAN